jgi:hypothetical protein
MTSKAHLNKDEEIHSKVCRLLNVTFCLSRGNGLPKIVPMLLTLPVASVSCKKVFRRCQELENRLPAVHAQMILAYGEISSKACLTFPTACLLRMQRVDIGWAGDFTPVSNEINLVEGTLGEKLG